MEMSMENEQHEFFTAANADIVKQCAALRAGNTALLSALMDMVNQWFLRDKDTCGENDILHHSFMSCEEQAISVLIDAGMAEEVEPGKNGYRLLWSKLAERTPKQMSWEEAVNKFVTDPDERKRIFEMYPADEPCGDKQ